ncbi:MAG: apolipoprotein N-acyltransferase [Sulfurimonas sp.]|nr:MAG: apolipoprotein N-acyltransferase [Sulfurimonas sp.]
MNLKPKTYKPSNKETLLGLFTAILFSLFIYLEHFSITIKVLNTISALLSLALFLYIPKKSVLIAGFLIGLFWFYWIGYSFKYNDVAYMAPIVTFFFCLVYMLFFGVLAFTDKVYLRAILLFSLSFIEPFDWNWMQIELIFVDSYIGVFKYQLILVLFSISLVTYLKKSYKYLALLLILLSFNFEQTPLKETDLKIKLISTDIKQNQKWLRKNLSSTVEMIFLDINNAINDGYDIIVFPESVFPLYLNKNPNLKNILLNYSKKISIVAGSLLNENGVHYNVTYIFSEGKYKIAKKLVLVPFGEYIPLPKFARKFINDTFFAGASDFKTANKPTDFIIKGVKFRNAICYEATCSEIYEGDVNFVIATSNNAWFSPSIEPTIQKLLMRYYARKNSVTIYHSANWRGTGIVK